LRIILISDTHEQHEQVFVPPCDVLIHAGDLTYRGSPAATDMAIQWLDKQPAKYVVMIAGNHDWFFQKHPYAARELLHPTRIAYLENEAVIIKGVKFWGSPITPTFMDWAFNCDRADIFKYWDMIPDDTDVLITHGPPLSILDTPRLNDEHCGDYDLRVALKRVKPAVHVFGHIHGGYGTREIEPTKFYNASVVNEAYKVRNAPWVIEL
jgi:Icc-related predicted phosphoesterase